MKAATLGSACSRPKATRISISIPRTAYPDPKIFFHPDSEIFFGAQL